MNDPRAALPFTGERFVPGAPGEIWYEHWHRYHFAARLVQGSRVLDVACGAGYGSALLARHAREVIGVDVSREAIAHAGSTYAGISNLHFREGDCAGLPFDDGVFDVVVSFETIEHIAAQEQFLSEARRVLAPQGLLVLSCPNRREYSEARGIVNPFHVRELDRGELASLLAPRFPASAWYGQHVSFFSVIAAQITPAHVGDIFELSESTPLQAHAGHARPRYFVVLAALDAARLERIPPRLSVLADRDEWVYRDYEKVTASLASAHERGNALEREVATLQRAHREALRQRDTLVEEHAAAVRDRANAVSDAEVLREVIAQRDASIGAARAWQAKLQDDIATLKVELAQRESWSWWSTLPFRMLARIGRRRRS